MRFIPINPICLLILIHAWARVKKMPPDIAGDAGLDVSLPGWPEAVATSRQFRRWLGPLLRAETLGVDPNALAAAISSPLLRPTSSYVAPSELARIWGQARAPLLGEGFTLPQGCDPCAIGLTWQREWEGSLPGPVLDIITQAHQNKIHVWMHVPYSGEGIPLSEDVLRRSTQVGWSWWFQPPTKADELEAWFNLYRPAWGFWLCSPTSDQWAWPWMDMFSRTLVSKMGGKAFDRTWQYDARIKSAWNRIEEQVWKRGCEVLGGEDVAQELLAQALLNVVRSQQDMR